MGATTLTNPKENLDGIRCKGGMLTDTAELFGWNMKDFANPGNQARLSKISETPTSAFC
jgi:hypothetical protein